MIRLIKIELKKVMSYKTFWVLMGLYLFSLSFVLTMSQLLISKIVTEAGKQSPIPLPKVSLFIFPKIWQNLTYIAGYFNIFLAIIIIFFICNEFTYKTLRQNIISGLSRLEYLLGKIYFILVLSLGATIVIFLLGLVLGFIHSSDPSAGKIFGDYLQFIPGYFVQTSTYLLFVFFIAFLFKKSSLSIIALLFYTMMEQIIVWWKVSPDYTQLMPMKAFGRQIHFPRLPIPDIDGGAFHFQDYISIQDAGIAIVYAAIFVGLIYWLLRKRDL